MCMHRAQVWDGGDGGDGGDGSDGWDGWAERGQASTRGRREQGTGMRRGADSGREGSIRRAGWRCIIWQGWPAASESSRARSLIASRLSCLSAFSLRHRGPSGGETSTDRPTDRPRRRNRRRTAQRDCGCASSVWTPAEQKGSRIHLSAPLDCLFHGEKREGRRDVLPKLRCHSRQMTIPEQSIHSSEQRFRSPLSHSLSNGKSTCLGWRGVRAICVRSPRPHAVYISDPHREFRPSC